MNIDEMPAGREMDALVAEKVMGWTEVVVSGIPPEALGVPPESDALYQVVFVWDVKLPIPSYSTDIAAAEEVVKKMRFLTLADDDKTGTLWTVTNHCTVTVTSSTIGMMPLAICRAALKLMEGKNAHHGITPD